MKLSLNTQRRLFGYALGVGFVSFVFWQFSDGLPIFFGPRASAAEKAEGLDLFTHEWTVNDPLAHGDGLGPVFNANSCVACHFQGGVGGAGGNTMNVRNFIALPTQPDGDFSFGTIHASAISADLKESFGSLRKKFPVIPAHTVVRDEAPPPPPGHCGYIPGPVVIPAADPLRTDTVQTSALFGAGWLDRVSEKAIRNNHLRNQMKGAIDDFLLNFDSIPQGRPRILKDGRVGKFGWKAQFATLEEFVAAACANEVGLSTPSMAQAQPLDRPNYPVPAESDLNRRQFRALVAFVDTLPKPVEKLPEAKAERESAVHGKDLFKSIGCAVCHVPDMGGVRGIFTDFLLHKLDEAPPGGGGDGGSYGPRRPDVPLPPDFPEPDEWKTPPLWGVADSAPYMHDGSAPTLHAAILRHGSDAKAVRDAYKQLKAEDQKAVVDFLGTLKAPGNEVAAK